MRNGSPQTPDDTASEAARNQFLKSKYWVVATKTEAYLGTGRMPEADASYAEAYALAPEDWMIATTKDQRAKLEVSLANPPLRYVADKD